MKKTLLTFFLLFLLSNVFAQNVGIGTSNPLQKFHIAGNSNTLRIEGLKSGSTFNTAPSASTDKLVFVDANGDFRSVTSGSSGNILTINGSGILTWAAPATSGTVTNLSVVTANGVSGSVATSTTTPAITLTLGAITPSSVAATGNITAGGNITATGTIGGSNFSGTSSGTNTGDQTITLTSDVTGSGTGSFATTIANNAVTTAKINNNAVTYGKMQAMTTNMLLGSGAGTAVSEIGLGTGLSFSGGNLTYTLPAGTVTANNGLTVNTGNNVQLGGTLSANTTITTTGFDMIFAGTSSNFGIGLATAPALKLDVNGGIMSRSTGFRAPNGTAASPSFHFTNETGTGLYNLVTGSAQLGFSVASALGGSGGVSKMILSGSRLSLASGVDFAPNNLPGSAPVAGTSANYLQSAGAGASPIWANPQVAQFNHLTTYSGALVNNGAIMMGNGGWQFGATWTPATVVSFNNLASAGDAAYYTNTAITLNNVRLRGWIETQAAAGTGNMVIYLVKYSLGAGPLTLNTTTGVASTSLGSVTVNIAVATSSYAFDLNIGTVTLAAGDVIIPYVLNSSGASKFIAVDGKLAWTVNADALIN